MNFAAFQTWREHCLCLNPNLLDCAETNLYRSLRYLQPKPAAPEKDHRVHRCDLARDWLSRFGLPAILSRQALVCRGVRHALTLIFGELARKNAVLWIPNDVYPVYLEIARKAGVEPRLYSTLPQPRLPAFLTNAGTEYLLVTNPWKPLGRYLTVEECDNLSLWLNGSPQRHLLLDCVYDLGEVFHATTLKLLSTGRAILLHSVTKGWLWPKTFGVALIGKDHSEFESVFRNDSPTPEQLCLAKQLFSTDTDCPNRVVDALDARARKLFIALPQPVYQSIPTEPRNSAKGCYFFPVRIPAQVLLAQHKVIGIPASAFGANWDGSILTSLSELFAPTKEGVAA